MAKPIAFLLLIASCYGWAVPFGIAQGLVQKRQLGGLLDLLSGSFGLLQGNTDSSTVKFLGEPNAMQSVSSFATLLGATKTKPGMLYKWNQNAVNAGYGIVRDPPDASPRRVMLQTRTSVPGSYTVKIRYGPYLIPKMDKKNLIGDSGMLSNYPHTNMEKPCTGECTIIGMEAGLEFANGTSANIDSGMWLHHMVMFNAGPGREESVCTIMDVSVPHVTINATARSSERFFASGNERTIGIFPEWGISDTGYRIKSTDSFAGLLEFMNENMEDKLVYMTITYDTVDGYPFKDDLRCVWFDVRQCGTSEVNPPKGQNRFSLDYTWTSDIQGEAIGFIGHLHDGGESITLKVGGQNTCTNVAKYGTKPEYVQKAAKGHHSQGALTHISELLPCFGSELPKKEVKVGQNWTLTANYNFDKHLGMKYEDGDWDAVMGIGMLFVRVKGK